MALYLPVYVAESSWSSDDADRRTVATVMLEHARRLLEGLGYGGPVLAPGVGLDYGEAFVGTIGVVLPDVPHFTADTRMTGFGIRRPDPDSYAFDR